MLGTETERSRNPCTCFKFISSSRDRFRKEREKPKKYQFEKQNERLHAARISLLTESFLVKIYYSLLEKIRRSVLFFGFGISVCVFCYLNATSRVSFFFSFFFFPFVEFVSIFFLALLLSCIYSKKTKTEGWRIGERGKSAMYYFTL